MNDFILVDYLDLKLTVQSIDLFPDNVFAVVHVVFDTIEYNHLENKTKMLRNRIDFEFILPIVSVSVCNSDIVCSSC